MLFKDSFQRGDCCCDLGPGTLEIKRHWQTSLATSYRYTHFPLSVARAQLLRINRWLQEKIHGPRYVACAQTA